MLVVSVGRLSRRWTGGLAEFFSAGGRRLIRRLTGLIRTLDFPYQNYCGSECPGGRSRHLSQRPGGQRGTELDWWRSCLAASQSAVDTRLKLGQRDWVVSSYELLIGWRRRPSYAKTTLARCEAVVTARALLRTWRAVGSRVANIVNTTRGDIGRKTE